MINPRRVRVRVRGIRSDCTAVSQAVRPADSLPTNRAAELHSSGKASKVRILDYLREWRGNKLEEMLANRVWRLVFSHG